MYRQKRNPGLADILIFTVNMPNFITKTFITAKTKSVSGSECSDTLLTFIYDKRDKRYAVRACHEWFSFARK